MKKTWVLLSVLAVLMLCLTACGKKETPAEAPVAAPEPEPEPVAPAPVVPEVPTEYKGATEVISGVVCSGGKVSGTLTNTAAQAVQLGTDMKVMLRGMNVKTLECDSMQVDAGASVHCSSLNGVYPVVPGVNKITVRLLEAKDVVAEVSCE